MMVCGCKRVVVEKYKKTAYSVKRTKHEFIIDFAYYRIYLVTKCRGEHEEQS